MKKVFAFLSTLLLTIAMVGVVAAGSHVKAASDKIITITSKTLKTFFIFLFSSLKSYRHFLYKISFCN